MVSFPWNLGFGGQRAENEEMSSWERYLIGFFLSYNAVFLGCV